MKERPDFPLMRQTDVQQIYHMQMPRWLFSDRRYSDMSLEPKWLYLPAQPLPALPQEWLGQ